MRTWSEDHPKARLLERKQEAIKVAAKELFLGTLPRSGADVLSPEL
jgi:hypothetical protein